MTYNVYLFGGLYDQTYNKQDAVDTVAFLEDEHGDGSACMESTVYPIPPEPSCWADDYVY